MGQTHDPTQVNVGADNKLIKENLSPQQHDYKIKLLTLQLSYLLIKAYKEPHGLGFAFMTILILFYFFFINVNYAL